MAKKLLFVCTGNTCRSPLAQVIAQALLKEAGIDTWEVASAGVAALPQAAASVNAQKVAEEMGLTLSHHGSQLLSWDLAAKADLIITMTQAHKEFILQQWPHLTHHTFTLTEFSSVGADVSDPYGGSVERYRQTAAELVGLLQNLVKKLER